ADNRYWNIVGCDNFTDNVWIAAEMAFPISVADHCSGWGTGPVVVNRQCAAPYSLYAENVEVISGCDKAGCNVGLPIGDDVGADRGTSDQIHQRLIGLPELQVHGIGERRISVHTVLFGMTVLGDTRRRIVPSDPSESHQLVRLVCRNLL